MNHDIMEKRAQFIAKNNELNQEFYYAHPDTKIWINKIYNSSFYGAPLWDMSCKNLVKLEKSWNVSARIMLSLPRNTHRYFVEPITKSDHIIKSLRRRFRNFIVKIETGKKIVLNRLLDVIRYDTRSTTGKNLRCMDIKTNDTTASYYPIPPHEEWRISMVREIIEIKSGNLRTNMSKEELTDICDFVCGS